MTTELLIALGIPTACLLISTPTVLRWDVEPPGVLLHLNSRDALLWDTMGAITIAIGALRWALTRRDNPPSTSRT